MATLLVADGTRNPHGVRMINDLAAAMARSLDEAVLVSFVDVLGPAPDEVLQTLHHDPTVVVCPRCCPAASTCDPTCRDLLRRPGIRRSGSLTPSDRHGI